MTATIGYGTRRSTCRVGLIGAGGIGRAHAQAVTGLDGAVLTAVADVDPAVARAVAGAHEANAVTPLELADRDRVDLVIVATPPATHGDVVEPLLRAGVPVLCEKPIAIDLAAGRRLAALASETGTPLGMATKFRFVADITRTRELITSGALGQVVKVEVTFASRALMAERWNADPAVAGGGVLIDNATHAVDIVRYLIGDVHEVLVAVGPSAQGLAVEDSVTLLARTTSGALAQVDVTWSFARLSPVYCAVYGSTGCVEVGWGGARAFTSERAEPFSFGTGYNKIDSLRANLAAVLDALRSGASLPVGVADAVAAAAVVEAGYESASTGRWTRVGADVA